MRITDLLDKKSVTLDLVASTKMEAIDKMVDLVGNSGNLNNKEEYKKAIIARRNEYNRNRRRSCNTSCKN